MITRRITRPLVLPQSRSSSTYRAAARRRARCWRARHGLTPAELRVATALTQTSGMQATAAMLGISSNTLKSHTKRIYAKIGIRGHAELVQSIAQIARTLDPSV
ncbi:helix-turn-helix transcriptional regulator [Bradyrhizobium cosmicum]|uniref:helix-turn-helix transcriptional regulator n=1 Tax=Bradyrhizobium cosmicum TaxID=1404864 RepID=UPI0028E36CF2|nr:LuxR C-terminal-related transcriptional regulator [Bradyrhizobium cosmicum]